MYKNCLKEVIGYFVIALSVTKADALVKYSSQFCMPERASDKVELEELSDRKAVFSSIGDKASD